MQAASAPWLLAFGTICIAMAIGSVGCSNSTAPVTSAAARVGVEILSMEAVIQHVPPGIDPADSVAIAERYIEQWIREQILVNQAEKALVNQELGFEAELTAYRNALVLHSYKERYANERLETDVSEEEAIAYYEENEKSFVMTDYGLRALFINAPSSVQVDEVRDAFSNLDSTQIISIEGWCVDNAAIYALDGETWWDLSDFIREVPMNLYRTASQLSNRRLIEFEANDRIYLVRILEHALKDQVAPFSAVRQEVEEMIVHQRRQSILLDMEEQLVVKAWSEGNVERYTP